jgi:FADH2 O2-dependent halogenase
MRNRYDVVILGSSFSGSILAAVLVSQGMRVLMLDRGQHPRFAIGESSTPTADFLLEAIAKRWSLNTLLPLARWGSWQQAYPNVMAGKKRGFSYFAHQPCQSFVDTSSNANSLLVAASTNDALSDTHWLRADVDHFLFMQAQKLGVDTVERCDPIHVSKGDAWSISWQSKRNGQSSNQHAKATWLIDSTGAGGALAKAVGLYANDHQLLTQTGAIFAHFQDVASWDELQEQVHNLSTLKPFRSDDAAQHHVMPHGWMWMLRFKNKCSSVGIVKPTSYWQSRSIDSADLQSAWLNEINPFPSIVQMFQNARLIQPLRFQKRLSRIWSAASGDNWALLPTTAGFIDPLHSSGIAHALSGVYRLASLLLNHEHDHEAWNQYGREVLDEVYWIDQLVDACYTSQPDFEIFCMAANFYFIAAIDAERDFSLTNQAKARSDTYSELPSFLSCQKLPLRDAISLSIRQVKFLKQKYNLAPLPDSIRQTWLNETRERLAPWNHADLGNPEARNRYARSAAEK